MPTQTQKLSIDQFAQSIKAKYPAYQNIDNATLAQKMLAKYPQYADKIEQSSATTPDASGFKPSAVGGMPTIPYMQNAGVPGQVANTAIGGVNAMANMGVGVGATIGAAGTSLAAAGAKGVGAIAGMMGNPGAAQFWNQTGDAASALSKDLFQNPTQHNTATMPGMAGQVVGQAALLASPTGKVAAGKAALAPVADAVGGALAKAPAIGTGLSYIASRVLNAIPEALAGTGYGLSQGQDAKGAAETGAGFGALSVAGEVGGSLMNKMRGDLYTNVGKAIGLTGKMTGGMALNRIPQATRALSLISKMAPDLKVMDRHGVEKAFEPAKATFEETLQAWQQTRDSVYKAYTELATKAGDKAAMFTAKDVQQVEQVLADAQKDTTGTYVTQANKLQADMQRNFGKDYFNVPLPRIQKFLESVNKDVNPLSDAAGSEVSGMVSRKIREIMDSKIESATGGNYQQLRNSYSDLKSVEKDLVNQFKKSARGVGGTIGKYLEGFGTADIVISLITKSPAEMARGGFDIAIAQTIKNLKDPEVALQKAFGMLEDKAPSAARVRAIGAPTNIQAQIPPPVRGLPAPPLPQPVK